MNVSCLKQLNDCVARLLKDGTVADTISHLKEQIGRTNGPFVWSVIDPASCPDGLPESLQSAWVFVLRAGVPSGCHYHPNSVQHMVLVEGRGLSKVGGDFREMIVFGSPDHSLEEIWYVIGEGVEHEFFPVEENMVVISFHTCAAHELEEVACATGESRRYESD